MTVAPTPRDAIVAILLLFGIATVALWAAPHLQTGGDVATPDAPRLPVAGGADAAAQAPRTQQRPARPLRPGPPVKLRLPVLAVSAPIQPIELDAARTLVPPDDPLTVGWWADGAPPGAPRGTALLTGHTVHSGGGALDELEYMRPGDRVIVTTRRTELTYVVAAVRIYTKGRLAERASGVFSQTVSGRLAIVTCEDWDGDSYLSNVVVIAKPLVRPPA